MKALNCCIHFFVLFQALVAADRVFGSDTNKRGYKVVRGCGVIQGDGIDLAVLSQIAGAVEAAGFSAENVAYGMGGGLLQKVRIREKHGRGGKASLLQQAGHETEIKIAGAIVLHRHTGRPAVKRVRGPGGARVSG